MNSFKSATAEEVKALLNKGENLILLDVRSPEEYTRSRIEGSINLPYEMVESKIGKLVPDKKTKIVVYCLSGSRSNIAAQNLIVLNYSNVIDMANGLMGWRLKGLPLETD